MLCTIQNFIALSTRVLARPRPCNALHYLNRGHSLPPSMQNCRLLKERPKSQTVLLYTRTTLEHASEPVNLVYCLGMILASIS